MLHIPREIFVHEKFRCLLLGAKLLYYYHAFLRVLLCVGKRMYGNECRAFFSLAIAMVSMDGFLHLSAACFWRDMSTEAKSSMASFLTREFVCA